jgi:hypothetical protein
MIYYQKACPRAAPIQVRGQQQFFTVCVVTATQPNYKEILAYYMIP